MRSNHAVRPGPTAPGKASDIGPGELVDFCSMSQTKDVSGWDGPAEIVKMGTNRRTVTVDYCGCELVRKIEDVRRFMDFDGLAYGGPPNFSC